MAYGMYMTAAIQQRRRAAGFGDVSDPFNIGLNTLSLTGSTSLIPSYSTAAPAPTTTTGGGTDWLGSAGTFLGSLGKTLFGTGGAPAPVAGAAAPAAAPSPFTPGVIAAIAIAVLGIGALVFLKKK